MSAGKSRRFNPSAVITEAAVITASVSSVVTGTGTCFSSGADFKSTLQREGERAPHERSYAMYEPFLSLLDLAVPAGATDPR